MMTKFADGGIPNAENVAGKVREAFEKQSNWKRSEAEMREVRRQVTFAIFSEEDDLNKVTATVDALFTLLQRSYQRRSAGVTGTNSKPACWSGPRAPPRGP